MHTLREHDLGVALQLATTVDSFLVFLPSIDLSPGRIETENHRRDSSVFCRAAPARRNFSRLSFDAARAPFLVPEEFSSLGLSAADPSLDFQRTPRRLGSNDSDDAEHQHDERRRERRQHP